MTRSGTVSHPDITDAGPAPASRLETMLTLFGGIWLVIGLFVDGYAHSEILDTETEDFFTPWHGLFYSGFVFCAGVIVKIAVDRASSGPFWTWLPVGYGTAAAGLGVFAVGGVGDGIWHTLFGIETGTDALLSPTHLLLFVGMGAILTAPARAAWADPERRAGWSELGSALTSVALATSLLLFFFTYVFGYNAMWAPTNYYDPVTEEGELIVTFGLGAAYVATVLLLSPTLWLLRRWDLPKGAVVLLWGLPVTAENAAFGGDGAAVPAIVLSAVLFELTLHATRRVMPRRAAILFTSFLGTLGMWTIWTGVVHLTLGVAWVPEIWSGLIVMSAIIALGLAHLAFAAPAPTLDGSVEAVLGPDDVLEDA